MENIYYQKISGGHHFMGDIIKSYIISNLAKLPLTNLTVLLPTLPNSHILIWLFYSQPWQAPTYLFDCSIANRDKLPHTNLTVLLPTLPNSHTWLFYCQPFPTPTLDCSIIANLSQLPHLTVLLPTFPNSYTWLLYCQPCQTPTLDFSIANLAKLPHTNFTVVLPTLTNSHILISLLYCQPWQTPTY